jgi:hypothetical protein
MLMSLSPTDNYNFLDDLHDTRSKLTWSISNHTRYGLADLQLLTTVIVCVAVPFIEKLDELKNAVELVIIATSADGCVVPCKVEVLLYSSRATPEDDDVCELDPKEVAEPCESNEDGVSDVGVCPKPFRIYNLILAWLMDEVVLEIRDRVCAADSPSEDESRELEDEDDDEESEVTVLLLVVLLKSVGPSISFS